MQQPLSIAIAGSTERSAQCLSVLLASAAVRVCWALTPEPKPVGRKQLLTHNPVSVLAEHNSILIVEVHKKLDSSIQEALATHERPDILLVVDFGYLVPNWLLEFPKIAPVNIHPSALPRWRGSSPGQFALLYGDSDSAVSLMVMNEELDQGGIISQIPFSIDPAWTAGDYYKHSFSLVCETLVTLLLDFAGGKLPVKAQPLVSPTPIASRLSKADSFVPWELIHKAVQKTTDFAFEPHPELSPILAAAWQKSGSLQTTLERAVRAFSPWPRLWTLSPTNEGEKRLQILTAQLSDSRLLPCQVILEGKPVQRWEIFFT